MKITTFNPQIITKDAEPIVQLFQTLGFEKHHNPMGIGKLNVEGIRMKDANGFYLDVSSPDIQLPHDVTAVRMNVDDFEEAYQLLQKHGFKNFYGDGMVETKSSKSAVMISESGIVINLIHHIRNHDQQEGNTMSTVYHIIPPPHYYDIVEL